MQRLLLGGGLVLALVSAIAACLPVVRPPVPALNEEYDARLASIDTVDALMAAIEHGRPNASAVQKLDFADELVRRRFFHSYSYFRPDQDWVAWTLGRFWSDLASPVRPDDILKFRRAACSQQALVFQEVARRLGFEFASVGAPGHFVTVVKVDGRWWVYDANREITARRYPLSWLVHGDPRLGKLYQPAFAAKLQAGAGRGQVELRDVNRNPAPQASLLHSATHRLSRYGWLAVLLLWGLVTLAGLPVREPGRKLRPAMLDA